MRRMRRMFHSRKAMWNVLLGMILVLAGGAVIGAMAFQIYKAMQGSDEIEKCRLSLLANDQLGRIPVANQGNENLISFDCKRQNLNIELEDVDTSGRIDDEKMKSILAHEMKECWAMTGAGELDPFRTLEEVNDKFCLICTQIRFDEEVLSAARDQSYSLKGFHYWAISRKLYDAPGSLYEVIRGTRPSDRLLEIFQPTANSDGSIINLDKSYVVVWRVDKIEQGSPPPAEWLFVGAGGHLARFAIDMTSSVFSGQQWGYFVMPSEVIGGAQSGMSFGLGQRTALGAFGTGQSQDTLPHVMFQQVFLMPEDALMNPLQYGNRQMEFCTWMIN